MTGGIMPKNILIVVGSPRENGNSEILANEVARGARDISGANVQIFNLYKLAIRPCIACEVCRLENSTGCVIKDDMQMLYPKLVEADTVVIASPIYFKSVSAQTKLFIDRFYCLIGTNRNNALAGKRFGIILVYANVDPYVSGCVNAIRMFQDIFEYIGAEIVEIIYGRAHKAGAARTDQELMQKAYNLGVKIGS